MGFTCLTSFRLCCGEKKVSLGKKQFPQSRWLMIVFHVDIITNEPIQTACSWLKLCCVLYSFHRVLALSVLVL